jgi:cellulose/xylan binding protein with CBM9 domain
MNNKYIKISCFLLAVIVVAFLVSFVTSRTMLKIFQDNGFEKKVYPGTSKQLRAISNGWSSLYHLPQENPARFALNEIAMRDSRRAFNLLRGDWPGSDKDREKAVETLKKLRKRIDLGLKWPYKTPPSYEIPYTNIVPEIDGKLKDHVWDAALSFKGSYSLDSVTGKDDGSIWKIMRDHKYIYVGAYFPDSHLIVSKKAGHPYKGDSLEIFLMPSKRMKKYWEVVIGCDGDLFDGFHCNNIYGRWAPDSAVEMKGLKFKTLKKKDGFSVEVAIPFSELPNYMLGNQPKPGETIHFALVRTNKDMENGKVEFSSAFPLLYGGHNVFGHAKGVLK